MVSKMHHEYIFTDDPKAAIIKIMLEEFDNLLPLRVEEVDEISLTFTNNEYDKLSQESRDLLEKHMSKDKHEYNDKVTGCRRM